MARAASEPSPSARSAVGGSRPLVEVRGLKKRYGQEPVLRGLNLTIRPGEFVAVTGPSGSGKSTLLNVIGGLDEEYEGEVLLDGRELARLDDRARSRLRGTLIGFVFQSFNLLEHLSCRENVLLPSHFGPAAPAADAAARLRLANERLERVGLLGKADARPTQLSGGQKQRVAIARALANRPRLMLCDEPTGNLDARTGAQILALFQSLYAEDGITFVVVTHEDRVSRMANRVIRLEDGEVVDDRRQTPERPEPGVEPLPEGAAEPAQRAARRPAPRGVA